MGAKDGWSQMRGWKWLVLAQHAHFFYARSNFRVPRNGYKNLSIYIYFFKLNSPVQTLLFELCNGLFLNIKSIYSCILKPVSVLYLVFSVFPQNSVFHFYIWKELTNTKGIYIYIPLSNGVESKKINYDIYQNIQNFKISQFRNFQ